MTLEDAIKNREDCLKYLEGLGQKASPQNVEAVRWSVRALKFMQSLTLTPPNEPLTLEQLRGMDGQPVWCEWLLPEDRAVENGKWFIVIIGDKTGLEIKRPADYGNYFLKTEDYGKTWLAYRYPPVATDTDVGGKLDEWTAEWIKHDGYTECSKCEHWYDSPENEDDGDRPAFCPSCGRAMTPDAWTELEKRLA